ncbi:MAG: hypothetical protein SOX72_07950 [Oscillospiraceae bacterium]|nr:hypothetical protein [Oscillospiraceae bacterium]MDY4192130.1 hypothetical protein [Oscillospiraceae bacterium]
MTEEFFPEMTEGRYGPECEAGLPAWEEFYWAEGPSGPLMLDLGGDEEPVYPPDEEQVRAWEWVSAHQEEVCSRVLQAVFDRMEERLRDLETEEMDDDEPWEADLRFPRVQYPGELRDWMRPRRVHILNVYRDGMAYVGYEFACSWDGEHGVGVLTHGGRVVEVGDADTSMLSWLARDDAARGE